ncbi:MAG: hypothetical protein D6707_01635, partial [Bacteroidetes bacterium]
MRISRGGVMEIKVIIAIILVIALFLFWLIPKLNFARKLKMNQAIFYLVHSMGILCGLAGLGATIWIGSEIMVKHYFELLMMPLFLCYLFLAILFRIQGEDKVLDEKQNLNMTQAAAFAFVATLFFSFLLYAVDKSGAWIGLAFFPAFFSFSIFVYSGATLYYFLR